MPSLIADKITGMALLSATLAALVHRERTGQGQLVEVPMLETLAAFVAVEHLGGLAFDPPSAAGYERLRHRKPVPTEDGWMTLLPYTAAHWRAFFTAAGPAGADRGAGRRRPGQAQREHRQGLCRLRRDRPHPHHRRMAGAVRGAGHPRHRLLPAGGRAGASAPEGRGHVPDHGAPDRGPLPHARPPTRFDATPANIRRHPPRLGEHSAEMLAEIGYDEAAVRELAAQGCGEARRLRAYPGRHRVGPAGLSRPGGVRPACR